MQQLVRFDWAIKYLLRHKANFDILEGFLSELLKIDIIMLEQKFQAIPKQYVQKLKQASYEQLQKWISRVFVYSTFDEILEEG